jgi:hypothetical protein
MAEFLTDNLWRELKRRARGTNQKRAAVAYFTRDWLGFEKDDLLICDATHQAIASGQTSAKLLAELHRRGVELYSCAALHAKVVVLDGWTFVSSANLSASSEAEGGLIEAGVASDTQAFRKAAVDFIEQVRLKATVLDAPRIVSLAEIEVQKHGRSDVCGANEGIVTIETSKVEAWLVYAVPWDLPTDPEDKRKYRQGREAARKKMDNPKRMPKMVEMPSSSRMVKRAKLNDDLILITGENNRTGHAKVEHHARVLYTQTNGSGNRTYVYYEPSLDASRKPIRWAEFKKLAKKIWFQGSTKGQEANSRTVRIS